MLITRYVLFTMPACTKCLAVKKFMATVQVKGEEINAAEESGFKNAMEYDIMSTPTIIFFDDSGKEVCRASNVEEARKCLSK